MHMRSRALIIVAGLVSLMLLSYAMLRDHATKNADRDINAFFTDFAHADSALIDKHLKYLAQPRDDANAIVSRHKEAMTNFNYSEIAPSLNAMLNQAVVGVS